MKTLVLIPILLLLAGCASLERTSYVSIGTIGASANAAIGAYQAYTAVHPASVEDIKIARRAVQVYLDAMEGARHAVTSYKLGDINEGKLTLAVDALSAATADVVKILSALSKP